MPLKDEKKRREYAARWRAENVEKRRIDHATYRRDKYLEREKELASKRYLANRERILARGKAYREANKEKVAARKAAYFKENQKASQTRQAAWRKANPERAREMGRMDRSNRRARISGNGGELSRGIIGTLWSEQHGRCVVCGVPLCRAGHHLDHVIPLARGGRHSDDNVQLLCPTCNKRKGSKDPIQFMKEAQGYEEKTCKLL